jgi:lysine-N-methylase
MGGVEQRPMPEPPAQEFVSPRYMTRFACIGGACEEHCCSGWDITVDKEHHREIRRAMSATEAGRAAFDAGVKRVEHAREPGKFALFVLKEPDARCSFLAEDRLCSLQRDHGEKLLPDTCATFPRRPTVVGRRFEMSGSLSCPEVARLALLSPDAMELDDIDPTAVPRRTLHAALRSDDPDTYARSLDEVRATLVTILQSDAPLSTRLATLVALADALQGWFARGAKFDPQRLTATLATFKNPQVAKAMEQGLASIQVPESIAMRLVVRALASRARYSLGSLSRHIQDALDAYGVKGGRTAEDITASYAASRDRLAPLTEADLQPLLQNYAVDYAFTAWFTSSPDLGIWVRGLLLRVALFRVLFFAHPDVSAFDASAAPDTTRATTRRVAVSLVSRMTRAFEHHRDFLALLDRELPAMAPGLEHALCLVQL